MKNKLLYFCISFILGCASEEILNDNNQELIFVPPESEIVYDVLDYFDLGNGSVLKIDKYSKIRLIWQRCSLGQKNDEACTGNPSKFKEWEDAKYYCDKLKLSGKNWRIPKNEEHYEFLKSQKDNFFPNSDDTSVRCVRDSTFDSNSYKNHKDGTVTDLETKLVWQRCSIGIIEDSIDCMGEPIKLIWGEASRYCKELNLANKIWRLPKVSELKTILTKSSKDNNYTNLKMLPNSIPSKYWSSSTYSDNLNEAWNIDFKDGWSGHVHKNQANYVRCIAD